MELSDRVRSILPARYSIELEDVVYLRTFNLITLPIADRAPSEYGWLLHGHPKESCFAAVDTQIYIPDQDVAVINIKLVENGLTVGRVAYWRGRIWGYSAAAIHGSMSDHLVDHNIWSWAVFVALLSKANVKLLDKLDSTCHWVQFVR